MQEFERWRPTTGHLIAGAVIDERQFVGAMPVAYVLMYVRDPRSLDRGRHGGDPSGLRDVEDALTVLPALQDANRRDASQYVERMLKANADRESGTDDEPDGVFPPIVLWNPEQLRTIERSTTATVLVLPHDTRFEALAGQTQVSAWHEFARRCPDQHMLLLPVVIHHGQPPEWARRAFRHIHRLAL